MKEINLKFKRAIALISDTHIGSPYALFPEFFINEKGNKVKANSMQKKLLEHWEFFWKKCDEFNVDLIIHLGDAIEGLNVKEKGDRLIFSSINEQIDCFVNLMREKVKGRRFLLLTGSQYHESTEIKIAKIIAEKLKGEYAEMFDLYLKDVGRRINLSHSAGSPVIYLSTTLDREIFFIKQAEALGKLKKIDIIARGHIHLFQEIHFEGSRAIFVPCWKIFEANRLTRKLFARKIPSVGGVIIAFDKDNKIYTIPFLDERQYSIDLYDRVL